MGNNQATVSPVAGSVITPTTTITVTMVDLTAYPESCLPTVCYGALPDESPFATFTNLNTFTFTSAYSGSSHSVTGNTLTLNLVRTGGFPQPPTLRLFTLDDVSNVQVFTFSWLFATASASVPATPLVRALATNTYQCVSASDGQTYLFDVMLDSNNVMSVRNVRGPFGLIMDAYTSLPDDVGNAIAQARRIMSQQLTETQVASGTLSFTGQTSQVVDLAAGVVNTTTYRVVYGTPDGTPMYTTEQSVAGFTANAASSYGTSDTPISVPYVVLVATQQASALSGTLIFKETDGGLRTITFPSAMSTANYRVVLSPNGFFPAQVVKQTRTGMSIQIGYTVAASETVTVGFDVFV
jgi:hypothetical protein